MKFVTLADLAATIRRNVHKIPHDVDFVIGVPRSGVIASSIIAEFLNAPLIDVDSFAAGALPTGGRRSRFHRRPATERHRVLVVDDTIFHGRSLRAAKEKSAAEFYLGTLLRDRRFDATAGSGLEADQLRHLDAVVIPAPHPDLLRTI